MIEAVNHSSNSTTAFTKNVTSSRNFFLVNAIVEFEEWLTAFIIRVGRFRRGVKTLLWITEQIPKVSLFNEANNERFELGHWVRSNVS